jgi:hypothetical protein
MLAEPSDGDTAGNGSPATIVADPDVSASAPVIPSESLRPWSTAYVVVVVGGGLALVALHAWLNTRLPTPQILSDEQRYMSNALALVSNARRSGAAYSSGYSFLLAPAAALTNSPDSFYRAALTTNAVLTISAPLLALLLAARLFPRAPRWVAPVSALFVALAPVTFGFVGLAMSENALVPLALGAALLIAVATKRDSLSLRLAACAAASFTLFVTPRGAIVAGACIIACTVGARRRAMALATTLLFAVTFVGIGRAVDLAVTGSTTVPGVSGRSHGLLWSVYHPEVWRVWAGATFGRIGYLGAASLGLTLVGIIVASTWVVNRASGDLGLVQRAVGVFAVLAAVGTVVADAAAIAGDPAYGRIDFLYYGRYAEAVAMPALVIGSGWLLTERRRSRRLLTAFAAASVIALGALAVPALVEHRPPNSSVNYVSILGVFWPRIVLEQRSIAKGIVIAAAVALVALLVASVRTRVFVVVAAMLFLSSALIVQVRFLEHNSRGRVRQRVVANAVSRLEREGVDTDCIPLERQSAVGFSNFSLFNYKFLLPRTRFPRYSEEGGCGPLTLSAGLGFAAVSPSSRLVTVENDVPMSLWIDLDRLPADVRERVIAAGLVYPATPCAALPDGSYDADLRARLTGQNDDAITQRDILVDVKRGPRGAPWLGGLATAEPNGCGRTVVSATLVDDRGSVLSETLLGLPRSLFPGDHVRVRGPLVRAKNGTSVPILDPARRYHVNVRLVQERVRAFGGPNGEGITIGLS